MKRVLITATVQSHICQFHKPLVQMLHEHGFEVHAAARNNLAEKNGLSIDFVDQVFDVPFSRSPASTDNLRAYKELKRIIDEGEYDVIHCNTPMGGIITRLASRAARKKGTKVFYTAHGFHFYNGAPKKNWLIYYPIEKRMAPLCDKLITINEEDFQLAEKKFKTKVEHIHGVGVDPDRYHRVSEAEAREMRGKEGLAEDDFVVVCVGELNENKNQKTLIAAAEKLKGTIPNLKVLLAGNGPMEEALKAQIEAAGLTEQVILLGYRRDLEKVVPAADVAVSCSFREGLPLNIIEAELCGKPIVASTNRGHNELVKDGINGYLVKPDDPVLFAQKIKELWENPNFAHKMGEGGYKSALNYTVDNVVKELKDIYCAVFSE